MLRANCPLGSGDGVVSIPPLVPFFLSFVFFLLVLFFLSFPDLFSSLPFLDDHQKKWRATVRSAIAHEDRWDSSL